MESDFSQLKVLAVDDNEVNLVVLQGFIKKLGIQIDFASNGQEALEALEVKSYDIVFMDCHMPVMDGFTATKKIIETYGDQRPHIIALTASTMQQDIQRCQDCGMDHFLAKPYKRDELIKILNMIIQEKQAA